MSCDRIRDQIPEYICQALDGRKLAIFESHLETCPECREELETFKKIDARLKEGVPALWEEIEPSPQFMARLKRVEFDPQPEAKPGIIDSFYSLWTNHRMAMAAGLSVCLIIVVMIAINPLGSDDGDESQEVASRDLTLSASESSVGQGVTVTEVDDVNEGAFSLTTMDPAGAAGTQKASDELNVTGSGLVAPSTTEPPTKEIPAPEPAAVDTPLTESLTTEEITALAQKIALADDEVQQYLAGEEPLSIEVITFQIGFNDFSCNGPLVIIQRAEPLTDEAFILACVNLETPEVEGVKTAPLPPPTQITEPPRNITPEPTLQPTP